MDVLSCWGISPEHRLMFSTAFLAIVVVSLTSPTDHCESVVYSSRAKYPLATSIKRRSDGAEAAAGSHSIWIKTLTTAYNGV